MTDTELLDYFDREGIKLCFAVPTMEGQEIIVSAHNIRDAMLTTITLNATQEQPTRLN
jgi:hypothetical protein